MSTTAPQKYWQRNTSGYSDYTIDTYSYNPFTGNLPSTTEHWKYIKYKPKNDGIQTTFDFVKPTDAVDDNIWVLYGGSGGIGGPLKFANLAGSGGGGTGELKMSLLNKTTFTSIGCTIGKLNEIPTVVYNYNYNTTSATTLAIKNNTDTIDTLMATGGFWGYIASTKTGAPGGAGANCNKYNGTDRMFINNAIQKYDTVNNNYSAVTTLTTQNSSRTYPPAPPPPTTTATATIVTTITDITGNSIFGYRYNTNTVTTDLYATSLITPTIPFGSIGGGGGWKLDNGSDAQMGDRYELTPQTNSTTIFDYKYIDETSVKRVCDGSYSGVLARFDISLSGITCDNTGTARILKPGDGGRHGNAGYNAEGGFIMFFYKTNVPLTVNKPRIKFQDSSIANGIKYNYNPYTDKIPGQIDNDLNNPGEDWLYYKYEYIYTDDTYMNFDHKIENLEGSNVWFLVGGPGGAGGPLHAEACGSGGGGGPGELVLSVWTKPTTKNANTDTFKIQIDPNNYNRASNFYSYNRVLYKTKLSDDTSSDVAFAVHGLNGEGSYYYNDDNYSVNNRGYNGGQGGYNTDANELATKTFTFTKSDLKNLSGITETNAKITTYRFGSGCGGGGDGNYGKDKGEVGNNAVVSGNKYSLVTNNALERTGRGCNVDFGKTLDGIQCDNTGIVELLIGGSGGKTTNVPNNASDKGSVGCHGPPGFIMIFYKTTASGALTENKYPPTI